eukprot:g9681.t1
MVSEISHLDASRSRWPLWSLMVGLTTTVWGQCEKRLARQWGCHPWRRALTRPSFRGKLAVSRVDGRLAFVHRNRRLFQARVIAVNLCFLCLWALVFGVQVATENYASLGAMFSVASVLSYHLFRLVANALTEAENHREESSWETSILLKKWALTVIVQCWAPLHLLFVRPYLWPCFSRGYAAGTGPESKPGVGEMPPGLNEEEALKWQMQARMGGADGVARMLVCWKYNVPPNWDGRSQLPPDLLEEPPEPENSFRTKTVSNKLNPVWNHTGKLVITEDQFAESADPPLRGGASRDDGKDEELGKAVLSYEQIAQGYEGELKLTDLRHTDARWSRGDGTAEERESAAIGRIQAKFRGVLERVLLKERRDLREAKRREEQKEIEETCPGGSCAPGFGFETHLSHYEVDQRFFLERKEKLRINTGAGPTRGLSSLPIPEGQPGPRQQGGVPPAVTFLLDDLDKFPH